MGSVVEPGNQRKLRNFFFKPNFQVKYGYHQVIAGFGFFGGTVYLVNEKLAEIDVLLQNNVIFETLVRNQINDGYTDIAKIALAGFAAYVTFTFIYSLLLSHRISGPMISIVAFIDELNKGNYGFKRALRRGDELGPIMNSLHELATTLIRKSRNDADDEQ